MRTLITTAGIVMTLIAAQAQAQIVAGGGMANPSTIGSLNMGMGANVASAGAAHSGIPMAGFGGSNLSTAATAHVGIGATVAGGGLNRGIGGVAGRFGQNINTATGMDMHVPANATTTGQQSQYLNNNPRTQYYNPVSQGSVYGMGGGGVGGVMPGTVSPNYGGGGIRPGMVSPGYGGSSMFGGGRSFARGVYSGYGSYGSGMNGAQYGSGFLPGGY